MFLNTRFHICTVPNRIGNSATVPLLFSKWPTRTKLKSGNCIFSKKHPTNYRRRGTHHARRATSASCGCAILFYPTNATSCMKVRNLILDVWKWTFWTTSCINSAIYSLSFVRVVGGLVLAPALSSSWCPWQSCNGPRPILLGKNNLVRSWL